jgi:hypothetical protein
VIHKKKARPKMRRAFQQKRMATACWACIVAKSICQRVRFRGVASRPQGTREGTINSLSTTYQQGRQIGGGRFRVWRIVANPACDPSPTWGPARTYQQRQSTVAAPQYPTSKDGFSAPSKAWPEKNGRATRPRDGPPGPQRAQASHHLALGRITT